MIVEILIAAGWLTATAPGTRPSSMPAQGAPRVSFFGSSDRAYRICYVVDRSGSLLDTFTYIRRELKESIRALEPTQQFHVILLGGRKPKEMPPGKLVCASPSTKEKALKYLDTVVPGGQTHPGPALERAFARKAELVYFITDGDFDAKILALLRGLNRDKKVKINTVAFLSKPGKALLKQIAEEHGGRFLSEKHLLRDVGLRGHLSAPDVADPIVSVSQDDCAELMKALRIGDEDGVRELARESRIMFVEADARVLVIDRAQALRRVRLLNGKAKGRAVWVPMMWIDPD